MENAVHRVRHIVFGEDKSRARIRNTRAVRDLIRGELRLAGYVHTATGRRTRTERHGVLARYDIT